MSKIERAGRNSGNLHEREDSEPRRESESVPADMETEVVVIGGGPGGYTAAFRSADLGKKTLLIERHEALGGVCLNAGCIPSKALLHEARLIDQARASRDHGISFGPPEVDLTLLRSWKQKVIGRLTRGLAHLAKQRKVERLHGLARFTSSHGLTVATAEGQRRVSFENAIIAAGSRSVRLTGMPEDDPRVMHSRAALELEEIPKRLLVIGAGIIGLELATVYRALGSRVTVVELLGSILPGCDVDLVRPLKARLQEGYANIYLETRVTRVEPRAEGLLAHLDGKDSPPEAIFDRILVAVGRRANGDLTEAETAGVKVEDSGIIRVDRQQRTNVANIFAIGDVAGEPMLAHKATHEARVAAEVSAGLNASFDAQAIPNVTYTDPEIAWVGITEAEAKAQALDYGKGVFPWAASGRALATGTETGLTKLIFDKADNRIIGAGIVGANAGDLISELALAIEMGCEAQDLALTIHPHPTTSETIALAAQVREGTITDLYLPKR